MAKLNVMTIPKSLKYKKIIIGNFRIKNSFLSFVAQLKIIMELNEISTTIAEEIKALIRKLWS